MILMLGVWTFLRALLGSSAAVTLENVALRHQLAVLQRSVGRPRLRRWDRLVWLWLSQLWAGWRASPATAARARSRRCGRGDEIEGDGRIAAAQTVDAGGPHSPVRRRLS